MDNLLAIWSGLDAKRRISLVVVTVGVFFAVLFMTKLANSTNYALLYSGLDAASAGEVVAALDASSVPYEIRGTAIYVAEGARDRMRMQLASEGLPAASSSGYELLEKMSGFGTTSQMFDAAYWRAKEGELARTISSAADIKSARVHIARESALTFQRSQQASASVTLSMHSTPPSKAQARAIQFLVASAVPQLAAKNVSIIDAGTGQIVSADEDSVGGVDAAARTLVLKQGVERILTARLGPNRSVVEVTLETITSEETITERRIDPESRTVISTDTEERSSQNEGSASGGVTVASNLPEGDAAAGGNQSSQDSETRERINYDMSQTERLVRMAPGAVKRITVAVLVDGLRSVDDSGVATWSPRSDEELAALKSLVEAAVGFDSERGDAITIHSMEFEAVSTELGSLPPPANIFSNIDLNKIIPIVLVILGGLLLGITVLRPLLSSGQSVPALPGPEGASMSEAGGTNTLAALPNRTGDSDFALPPMGMVENFDIEIENDNGMIVLPDLPGLPKTAAVGDEEEAEIDPVDRLKQMIKDRQDETIEILRGWMEEREEDA